MAIEIDEETKKNIGLALMTSDNILGGGTPSKSVEQEKEEVREEKREQQEKAKKAPLFVRDFDDEEPAREATVMDNETKEGIIEQIEEKALELNLENEELKKKDKGIDEVILNGSESERKIALSLKVEKEEYEDVVSDVLESILPQDAPEQKNDSPSASKTDVSKTVQATAAQESSEVENIVSNLQGESADYLVSILEKLEQVIELGNKILQKIDNFLEQTHVGVEKNVDLTQNTQAQMKM